MKAIISASFALLVSSQLFATTYYINSATGSDGNPGTQAAPFESGYKLNQITINPGDTVCFARGTTYLNPYLQFSQSGAAGQPITLTSYGTGSPPVFTNPNEFFILQLSGSHIVLDGLKFQTARGTAVEIWGSDCVVQNCEITDTGVGISIGGGPAATQHVRATSNTIHHLHMVYDDPEENNDSGATAFVITNAADGSPSDDIDLGWNRVSYCIANSTDYGKDGGAFEFYGPSSHVQIHHNWCDENNGVFEVGFAANGGTVSHVQIYYNLFEHNGLLGGFHLAGGSSYTGNIEDFRVENNTVFDTATGISNGVIWFDGTGSAAELSLTNNIFYYLGFSVFSNISTFAHNYNLYWGSSIGYTPNATEIIADPTFVNPSAEDFRLQSTSAAINAGVNLGYSYDRQANPIVNTPDLGAYESPY